MQHIRNHANPVQDCNFVLYDGSYTSSNGLASAQNAIFATQTSGQGTSPCRLLVSSANGGSISIVDATGRTVYLNPSAVVLPPVDSLAAGQTLAQGDRLYSDDGSYFLTVQSDGNLVLCASCTFQGPCTHDGVWHTNMSSAVPDRDPVLGAGTILSSTMATIPFRGLVCSLPTRTGVPPRHPSAL